MSTFSMPKMIAQSTAIKRGLEMDGLYQDVRRKGEWWTGIWVDGKRKKIGHVDQVTTTDYNGHSTRVYNHRDLVATVYGIVKF